MKIYTRDFKT